MHKKLRKIDIQRYFTMAYNFLSMGNRKIANNVAKSKGRIMPEPIYDIQPIPIIIIIRDAIFLRDVCVFIVLISS